MNEEIVAELLTRSRECPDCKGTGIIGEAHGFGPGGVDPADNRAECEKCHGSGYILDSVITDLIIKNGIKGRAMVEMAEAIFDHYREKLLDAYKRGAKEGVMKELQSRQEEEPGQESSS